MVEDRKFDDVQRWLSSYIQSCVRLDLQLKPSVSVRILLASPSLLSFLFVISASDMTLDVWCFQRPITGPLSFVCVKDTSCK